MACPTCTSRVPLLLGGKRRRAGGSAGPRGGDRGAALSALTAAARASPLPVGGGSRRAGLAVRRSLMLGAGARVPVCVRARLPCSSSPCCLVGRGSVGARVVRPARPRGCGASGRLSASPARHPPRAATVAVVGRRSARVLGPLFPLGRVVAPGARSLGVPVLPGNGDPDGWMGGRWRCVRAVRCVRVLAMSRGGAPAVGLSGARGRGRGGSPEAGSGVPGRRGTALACGGGIPCPFPWRARLSWPGVLPLRPLPHASGASPSVGGPGAAPTPPRCRCGLGRLPPPPRGGWTL